jgi:hypothetical protein
MIARTSFLLLCLFALSSACWATEWATSDINIDGTPVKLVLPTEYVRAPDDDAGLNHSRRILPEFIVFANYKTETPFLFVQVQMHKSARSYRYSRDSFREILTATKEQLPSFDTKGIKELFDKRLDEFEGVNASVLKPVIFPLASESDRHFIVPALMGLATGQDAKDRKVISLATITIALNGRLFYMQVYSPYEDKTSTAKVTALAVQIAEKTMAAN